MALPSEDVWKVRACMDCGSALFTWESFRCTRCYDSLEEMLRREPEGFGNFWHEVNMGSEHVIPVD